MSCARYEAAIVDHAFGAGIAADAAAHLDGCAACRQIFDARQREAADIGRQLQRAIGIEPSVQFVPAVMARVRRPADNGRRAAWWAAPVAVAAALIVAVLVTPRSVEDPVAIDRAVPVPSPTPPPVPELAPSESVASKSPAPEISPRESRRRRSAPASAPEAPASTHAEVLVPADQARALARYLTLVRRGVLDTSGLPASETAAAAWGELVIQPLSVEVLPAAESENMSGSAVDRRMGMR